MVKLARVKLQVASVALLSAAVSSCTNPDSPCLDQACRLVSKVRSAAALSPLPGQWQETDPPQVYSGPESKYLSEFHKLKSDEMACGLSTRRDLSPRSDWL